MFSTHSWVILFQSVLAVFQAVLWVYQRHLWLVHRRVKPLKTKTLLTMNSCEKWRVSFRLASFIPSLFPVHIFRANFGVNYLWIVNNLIIAFFCNKNTQVCNLKMPSIIIQFLHKSLHFMCSIYFIVVHWLYNRQASWWEKGRWKIESQSEQENACIIPNPVKKPQRDKNSSHPDQWALVRIVEVAVVAVTGMKIPNLPPTLRQDR